MHIGVGNLIACMEQNDNSDQRNDLKKQEWYVEGHRGLL